jgi:hypothetical protein
VMETGVISAALLAGCVPALGRSGPDRHSYGIATA